MKALLVSLLCLGAIVPAHAETISQVCQVPGFVADPNIPTDLTRVPTRPTLVLPVDRS